MQPTAQTEVDAESNSTSDEDGVIQVTSGDRIPLIPRQTGRLMLSYAFNERFDVGANIIYSSGAFLHGDENNANQTGGTSGEGALVIGSGRIGGYAVLNLNTNVKVTKNVEVFARVVNVTDKNYATAGFLTSNSFNPNGSFRADPDDWTNENAVSPAVPRAFWAGVRFKF